MLETALISVNWFLPIGSFSCPLFPQIISDRGKNYTFVSLPRSRSGPTHTNALRSTSVSADACIHCPRNGVVTWIIHFFRLSILLPPIIQSIYTFYSTLTAVSKPLNDLDIIFLGHSTSLSTSCTTGPRGRSKAPSGLKPADPG
jgi:hypothetical protein